jgi:hypothetical protein
VITAEIEDFGSPQYRSLALTLDINIQSGIYLYKRGRTRPNTSDMSYIECIEKSMGDLVYHLNQADMWHPAPQSVIESCYSARLFTFEGTDHQRTRSRSAANSPSSRRTPH